MIVVAEYRLRSGGGGTWSRTVTAAELERWLNHRLGHCSRIDLWVDL